MIIAVSNQKGGVGKTTTAVNLAAYLSRLGRSVLLVDSDPQANATTALGMRRTDVLGATLYEALVGTRAIEDTIIGTSLPGLDLLPASARLAGAEVELIEAGPFETRLRGLLREVSSRWDVTLIDCPPSLGVLTVNAIVAADAVIVPVQCEYLALEGLAQLMRTIEMTKGRANPTLRLLGPVLTMYDGRTNLAQQVAQEVRTHFPNAFSTMIPRSVRLSEAPSYGQTILEYDPGSRGAEAYGSLAEELLARIDSLGGVAA